MSKRPITALLAALALLAVTPAALYAQTPTPTPTATASQQDDEGAAEAPDDASKEVKAIYTDYRRDGRIDECDHARDRYVHRAVGALVHLQEQLVSTNG